MYVYRFSCTLKRVCLCTRIHISTCVGVRVCFWWQAHFLANAYTYINAYTLFWHARACMFTSYMRIVYCSKCSHDRKNTTKPRRALLGVHPYLPSPLGGLADSHPHPQLRVLVGRPNSHRHARLWFLQCLHNPGHSIHLGICRIVMTYGHGCTVTLNWIHVRSTPGSMPPPGQ